LGPSSLPPEGVPYTEALNQRLAGILYRCLEDVGSTKAALYLVLPGMHEFQLVSHYGWPRTQPPQPHLGPDHPLLLLMQREKRGLIVNDLASYPELAPFAPHTTFPRFYLSPIFNSGDWVGLLVQRDPHRGDPFEKDKHEAQTLAICEEVARAVGGAMVKPPAAERKERAAPVPAAPPGVVPEFVEDQPTLRVPAPPTGAMIQVEEPFLQPEGEAIEAFLRSLEEPPPVAEPAREKLGQDLQEPAMAGLGPLLPEQQTFFWEAASLLCATVPAGAAALYISETTELQPILAYSRVPLAQELKAQITNHFMTQLPAIDPEAFRIIARCEWPEKAPQPGVFKTLLPVMLEEQFGEQDLLVLFRLEDRPFTDYEQDFIRQVSRMLGFYLQESRLHERYHQSFLSVSHRILASADGRLPSMRVQSVNTAERSRDLARRLRLSSAEVEAVSISAILHDVGTLLLDRTILDKPSLSAADMELVQTHPILASTFLTDLNFPFDILGIIRHHHERWDGKGYPDGLRGEAIPVGSRIIHLVESYEVMISGGTYKKPKPPAQAMAELEHLAGIQFDPTMVAEFVQMLTEGHL